MYNERSLYSVDKREKKKQSRIKNGLESRKQKIIHKWELNDEEFREQTAAIHGFGYRSKELEYNPAIIDIEPPEYFIRAISLIEEANLPIIFKFRKQESITHNDQIEEYMKIDKRNMSKKNKKFEITTTINSLLEKYIQEIRLIYLGKEEESGCIPTSLENLHFGLELIPAKDSPENFKTYLCFILIADKNPNLIMKTFKSTQEITSVCEARRCLLKTYRIDHFYNHLNTISLSLSNPIKYKHHKNALKIWRYKN